MPPALPECTRCHHRHADRCLVEVPLYTSYHLGAVPEPTTCGCPEPETEQHDEQCEADVVGPGLVTPCGCYGRLLATVPSDPWATMGPVPPPPF